MSKFHPPPAAGDEMVFSIFYGKDWITMTEIAMLADIHGNIPALTAAAADIAARGITTVYCLGDMCGRGPNGGAAIDWCREHCDVILMGNWDEHVALGRRQDYLQEAGPERQAFLQTLPLTHKFWMSGRRIHLFHGRPLINDIFMPEDSAERKSKMFSIVKDDCPPDIVIYADIHRQFKHDFKDSSRILMNTGSIGNSFCTATACYLILKGTFDSRDKTPISFEFVSVPYDNRQAAENVKKAEWFGSPEEYIKEVTTGTWQPNL